ncbi:DUF2905 domain-containing protein [Oceanithermus profundus]|uniref:DUF2905 domain-containing protein n=1 Tax=Oceanithermus profundus (strain DSM 14977 / NBRC 100410 / VKM B-2274 / 506) TaxID=670487 RepID=E4U4T4_OCEP5|nr:DUF2905 domain-containing protein [Oceanithermus profundus]ADR37151.1 hypothetical protein Ocepr_1698 [Oceanithermus profundus DSM 14977]
MSELGRWLVAVGLLIVFAGLLLWWWPALFGWFGHLPGDLRFERDGVRVFVPVTSMLLVSLILTLGLNLALWLLAALSR